MRTLRDMLKVSSIVFSTAFTLIMVTTFMVTYMSPGKVILLHINRFGEADMELFVVMVILAVILAGLYCMCRDAVR